MILLPRGEIEEKICADTVLGISGSLRAELECRAFNCISDCDYTLSAPFIRCAGHLTTDWEVYGILGGRSAPYTDQGE